MVGSFVLHLSLGHMGLGKVCKHTSESLLYLYLLHAHVANAQVLESIMRDEPLIPAFMIIAQIRGICTPGQSHSSTASFVTFKQTTFLVQLQGPVTTAS